MSDKMKKLFFRVLPLLIVVFLFLSGNSYAILVLMDNIIFVVIGLVVYYIVLHRINRKNKIKNPLAGTANDSYAGEAGIVSVLASRVAGFNTKDLFPAAFNPEEINIRAYGDPDESLTGYKTFDFDYTNKTNPLLEKELFKQLEKALQSHGLIHIQKNPQITISMDFFIGKKEQYTPPQTVTSTEMKYVWNFGEFGGNYGGVSSVVPVTTSGVIPGYTTITYYSNIRLNFLDHARLVKGEKLETPPFIWIGEAENEGINSDIRIIAPAMLNELIREFPNHSVGVSKHYEQRICYGGLGLGFDKADWRVVRYVEPFSIAEENGIKQGDVILKVNGNRATINWAGRDTRYLKNPELYRSKDPYFQYVLSNRDNSEVELLVQSAETGKSVMYRMRPHNEDLYLHVDVVHSLAKIAKANPIGIVFGIIIAIAILYFFIKYVF